MIVKFLFQKHGQKDTEIGAIDPSFREHSIKTFALCLDLIRKIEFVTSDIFLMVERKHWLTR